jgi:hypothetical protein
MMIAANVPRSIPERSDEEDGRKKTQKTRKMRDEQRPRQGADLAQNSAGLLPVFLCLLCFFAAILLSRHRRCRPPSNRRTQPIRFRTGSVAAIKQFPFDLRGILKNVAFPVPGVFR